MKAWGQSLENNDTLIPPHLNVTLSPMWTSNISNGITKISIASVDKVHLSSISLMQFNQDNTVKTNHHTHAHNDQH